MFTNEGIEGNHATRKTSQVKSNKKTLQKNSIGTSRPPLQSKPFGTVRRAKEIKQNRKALSKTTKITSISPIRGANENNSNFLEGDNRFFSTTTSARKLSKEAESQYEHNADLVERHSR